MITNHAEVRSALAAALAGITSFAATNIDDLFVLTVFFARRVPMRRALVGQYLGFSAIVVVSLTGFWATIAIPHFWLRFCGLLPLGIGIKHLFRPDKPEVLSRNFNVLSIAAITLANGFDNVGVYVPLFAVSAHHLGLILFVYAFLVPIWCTLGKWLGERPIILQSVDRHGHWIVPVVFIALGLYILL